VILGELTYGKGLVQTLIPLDSDANLKLTTAKWYTPAGRCIQRPFADEEKEADEAALDPESTLETEKPENPETGAERSEGGIQPDITMESETVSRYAIELISANHFFRFAVNWTAGKPDVARGWQPDAAVVAAFREYLEEQKFDYETVAEKELGRLRDLSEREKFDASTGAAIEALDLQLAKEKVKDFDRHRDEIEYWIEREVMAKTYGSEGLYEAMLRTDKQVQAAVDLLKDPAAYAAALHGKEPIAAAAPKTR
jgi:carboxyl-terminal processing protease